MKNKKIALYAGIIICAIAIGSFFSLNQRNALEDYNAITENDPSRSADITVFLPKEGEGISSPVEVSGMAKGTWFFEGSFPVRVYDDKGALLGTGIAETTEPWMTENEISFFSKISFENPGNGEGLIRLSKDNPSGLPEFDLSYDLPVRFVSDTMEVKVYFGRYGTDSSMNACTEVYESVRVVERVDGVARAAVDELLKGVNGAEKDAKLFSSIPEGTVLQSIKIENGIAYADFNNLLNAGGSCRVAAIRSQIERTLKQFPTISRVVISVDGNSDEALQP